MDLNVKLTITLTERLFDLLERKLPNQIPLGWTPPTATEGAAVASSKAKAPAEPAAVAIELSKQEPEEAKPEEAKPEEAKPLTLADLRAAMARTRERIEGPDYLNKQTDEKVAKLHRNLTGEFKRIASTYGVDKPSQIPEDKYSAFIADCDALELSADGGHVEVKLPF